MNYARDRVVLVDQLRRFTLLDSIDLDEFPRVFPIRFIVFFIVFSGLNSKLL